MPQNIGFDLSGVGGSLIRRTWMLQRTYNWQLIMPHNFSGNLGFLVSQYCQDVRFGDYSMSELSKVRYGPYQRTYPGLQDIDVVSLTFLVPIDNSVYNYFYAWNELIVDANGFYHPKSEYKRNIYVIMYDRTSIQSTKFTLEGVFPRMKPQVVMSYASEGIVTLTMELSVDNIRSESFIGAVREKATNLLGDIGKRAKGIFGRTPTTKNVEWAGGNAVPGFGDTTTSAGTLFT